MNIDNIHGVYKIEKLYFRQVVNYFLVIDTLEELTLFFFNPDIYREDMQVYQIQVTRSELQKDIEEAEAKLEDFKVKWKKLENNLLNK